MTDDWRDAGQVKQWTLTIATQLRGELRQGI